MLLFMADSGCACATAIVFTYILVEIVLERKVVPILRVIPQLINVNKTIVSLLLKLIEMYI